MDQAKYALPRYPHNRVPKSCEGDFSFRFGRVISGGELIATGDAAFVTPLLGFAYAQAFTGHDARSKGCTWLAIH
jgi:hypothetical protein